MKQKPSVNRLRELLYEVDGVLYWRQSPSKHSPINHGDEAGYTTKKGYVRVTVDGCAMRGHIIVWALHHGEYPSCQLDHKNRIRDDNRIDNLREASNSGNASNRSAAKGGSSKYLGVSRRERQQDWRATIWKDGRQVFLGGFSSENDAARAYNAAAIRLHGVFASLNQIDDPPAHHPNA